MDITDFEMTGPIIIAIVFAVAFIIFSTLQEQFSLRENYGRRHLKVAK